MEKLFWTLYNVHTEDEIDQIIKKSKLLSDRNNWVPFGNENIGEGNYGLFDAQQHKSMPALAEKITNSIDAMLVKKCIEFGVNPQSNDAPNNMVEAVAKFFDVKDGEIGELSEKERRNLAENIQILVTGEKPTGGVKPSLTIYDDGEGQNPENFHNTFLSLLKRNKIKIKFVQGKYNMGGTGAVVFCGEKKYQLIASKRAKNLNKLHENKFGFTLVRQRPYDSYDEDVRATYYETFQPNGEIPSFSIDELDLGLYNRNFKTGSIVKLYSYQLPRGSRSDATLDLWRELNSIMYHLPIPVLIYEKRPYGGKSDSKPVLGNRSRISIDSRDMVEKSLNLSLKIDEKIPPVDIIITIFKEKESAKGFVRKKPVIFTVNGQVHAYEGIPFISSKLNLQLFKEKILIQINCSDFGVNLNKLFMSNRTHLKEGEFTNQFTDKIIKSISLNKELRKLHNEEKGKIIKSSNNNSKDFIKDLISKMPADKDLIRLLRKDGTLNFTKQKGNSFQNKFNKKKNKRKLERFPSIFNLKLNPKDGKMYKAIPLNSKGSVEIETNVDDDYLFRPVEKGSLEIKILKKEKIGSKSTSDGMNPNVIDDIIIVDRVGPSDGIIKLLIEPGKKAKIGDKVDVKINLSAPGEDFKCVFTVEVDEKIKKSEKKEPKNESFPDPPKLIRAFKEPSGNEDDLDWSNELLNWDGNDIVKIITDTGEGDYIVEGIIINMDSFSLINFISKNRIKQESQINSLKDIYMIKIYLHTLTLFSIFKKMRDENNNLDELDAEEFITNLIKHYADLLLYEHNQLLNFFDD